ncbi:MAG: leucine-rich repeat domain-containing protein [Dysgonamonadaceae bacterium]|nr:leucine-rich repeat domain-containing protein [Dysgonamonadaceae bacterium]
MKKSLFFCFSMLMLLLSATASYAESEGTLGENLTWKLDDEGTLTISGTGDMPDNQTPWTLADVKSLVVEEGVTKIGNSSFGFCTNLVSVSLPNSLTSIGNMSFSMGGFSSIVIPRKCTTIGFNAFMGCSKLKYLELPPRLTDIGMMAFSNCSSLEKVVVHWDDPSKVTCQFPFNGASVSSATLTVPAFCEAKYSARDYWKEFGTITGSPCRENIAGSIDWTICPYEDRLQLTIVGEGKTPKWWLNASEDPDKPLSPWCQANFWQYNLITKAVVSEGISELGDNTFANLDGLTSVSLPSTLKIIGSMTFLFCKISSIDLPDGLTNIKQGAFQMCSALTSIDIPASVESFGIMVFMGCTELKDFTVHWDTPVDGALAFFNWAEVSACTLHVPAGTKALYEAAEGWKEFGKIEEEVICTTGATGNLAWELCSTGTLTVSGNGEMPDYNEEDVPWADQLSAVTTVTVADGVTNIGAKAFADCENLTSITLPSSLTSIGNAAFSGCKSLTDIDIPASVTEIGAEAFAGCEGLTSITLPENLTTVKADLLRNCTALATVDIPASVTTIESGAFAGCELLASVDLPEGLTSIGDSAFYNCVALTAIEVPASVTAIGEGAFNNCAALASVNLPEGITSISKDVFRGCVALASIDIPASVTTIGEGAFAGCELLASIDIPVGVTSIEDYAFALCVAITEVTVYWDTPLTVSAEVFDEVTLSPIVLNVPGGTGNLYNAAEVWKEFTVNDPAGLAKISNGADITLKQLGDNLFIYSAWTNIDSVEVFDLTGRTVLQRKGFSAKSLPVASLGSGVYVIKLTKDGQTCVSKFVKK